MRGRTAVVLSLFVVVGSLGSSGGTLGCSSSVQGTPNGNDAGVDDGNGNADPSVVYDDFVIFTTKATFEGDLGGIRGADEKCNTYAKAAGLPGTFQAWLSDSRTDAIDRVPEAGPWRVLDKNGKQAAIAFADRSSWEGYPEVYLDKTEFGKTLGELSTTSTTDIPYTWTGTKLGGAREGCHCLDWTSADNSTTCDDGSYGGVIGSRMEKSPEEAWTNVTSNPCDAKSALLCYQVP